VTGALDSEQDFLVVNFLSNRRLIHLRDIAEIRRSSIDPPKPAFRVNGRPAIGLAIALRSGGDILALGRNVAQTISEATANLPIGVADQPAVMEHTIGDFMKSLWQAIAIIMAVGIALIVSWSVAVLFAPLLGVAILKKPTEAVSADEGTVLTVFRKILLAAMRARWVTIDLASPAHTDFDRSG
jgi:multidrug efflux pump subunit AcrB